MHPPLPFNPMQSLHAPAQRLPQVAGPRAAWSRLCTDLVADEVPHGEPALGASCSASTGSARSPPRPSTPSALRRTG